MRNILETTVVIALIERTGGTFGTPKFARKPVTKTFKEYLPRKGKGLLAPFWWELRDGLDEYIFRGTEADPFGLVAEYLTGGRAPRYEQVDIPDNTPVSFTLVLPDLANAVYLDLYSREYQRRYSSLSNDRRERSERFKL